jgi:hypothetical protein
MLSKESVAESERLEALIIKRNAEVDDLKR